MSKLEYDPGKAIGKGLLDMDRQELCRFVAGLCLHLQAELGSHAWRGGIFPENICVNEEGAYAIGPAKREKWTGQELEFVAPELYWHGETGPAADVYSLALLVYYGLGGGLLPFDTATSSGQLARMSGKVLPAPKSAGKRLGEVLEKATSFRPSDRYESPEQFGIMLESCLDNKYLGGSSGAEAVFKKEENQLSDIERMLVEIIERSGEEETEREEEESEVPSADLSPEEIAGMEKPDPVPVEKENVSAMVEEFFGSMGVLKDTEEENSEESEDVRLYEPSHERKDRQPIPILTVEENPELEPVVLRQQPRYSRNTSDPKVQQKADEEVKKRRSRRPLAVVLICCLLLLALALLANWLFFPPQRATQINPTPDPSAYYAQAVEEPEQTEETVVEPEQSIVVPVQPRYTVTVSDMSWTQARDACIAQGGHLAVISSREEFEEVKALAEAQGLTRFWIGCHRQNDQLVWETDDPVNYTNWAEGEPSYWDDYDSVPEDYIMVFKADNDWFYNDNRNDPAADYPQYYSGVMGYVCEFEN